MAIALALVAFLLFVAVVWLFALDRTAGKLLKRTAELDARLREHGL